MLRKWFHNLLLALVAASVLAMLIPAAPVYAAGTTSIKIVRLASDNLTTLAQVSLTYQQMRDTFPVLGDGTTHYYHQGPVFDGDRWDPTETHNLYDMGAVEGTNLVDLCKLVGGMAPGETLTANATPESPFRKTFAFKNVYEYDPSKEGPIGLTWFKDSMYPDSGYTEGMRLIWFPDDHVFSINDWKNAAEEQYWHFYQDQTRGDFPTTSGLSVKYVEQITIHSLQPSWDLNSDHTCNQDDISSLGQHWGQTSKSDPQGWIPDVNQDGVINIGDVVAIGYHWNQSW